jgi:hypothetical protein
MIKLNELSSQSSNCSNTALNTVGNDKDRITYLKENRDLLYDVLSGSLSSVANEIMAEIELSDDNS